MISVEPLKPYPLADVEALRREFDRCWDWLWAALCEFGPTHGKEQVWNVIIVERAYLWPASRCAILGEILHHPIGVSSFNYWLQGGDLVELLTLHAPIEAWAIAQGCHAALGFGRKGWIRKMAGDWHEVQTLRRKWLKPPPPEVSHARRQDFLAQSQRAPAGLETTAARAASSPSIKT